MFLATGTTSSVTQAAGSPADGVSADPKALVVLVKTKVWIPEATASSRRVSVPVTFVSTKSRLPWVATWGLCNVAAWTIARTPLMHPMTKSRSQIDPTASVNGDGRISMPRAGRPAARRVRPRAGRGRPAGLRRAGAWRVDGIGPVDVEGDIGRAVADDLARLGDDALDAELRHVLDMDHRHAAVVGELPEELGRAANADLDGARRVEHAVEHGEAEGAAVMELGALVLARGVAMGVDMDEPDRPLGAERFEDRIGDRVVAADGQRPHPCRLDHGVELGDVGDAALQAEARAQRPVADIA